MTKKVFIFAIVIIILLAAGAGYVWYVRENTQPHNQQPTTQNQDGEELIVSDIDLSTEALAEVDTSDWQTYRNEEYGFTMLVPSGYAPYELYENKKIEVDKLSELNKGFLIKKEKSTIQLSFEHVINYKLPGVDKTISNIFNDQVSNKKYIKIYSDNLIIYENIVHDKNGDLFLLPLDEYVVILFFSDTERNLVETILSTIKVN